MLLHLSLLPPFSPFPSTLHSLNPLSVGLNGPYPVLVKQRPEGKLASVNMLVRMVIHVVLIVGFQVAALYYLKSPTWPWTWWTIIVTWSYKLLDLFVLARYTPFRIMDPTERVSQCLENTVIFTMASFQYTGLAFALSIGPPYRKPTYTNCEQFPQLACKNFSFSLSHTHTHTQCFSWPSWESYPFAMSIWSSPLVIGYLHC